MRLNSTASNDVETYSNMSSATRERRKIHTGVETLIRNSSGEIPTPSYEDKSKVMAKHSEYGFTGSTRKQKPIKADHQVLRPSQRFKDTSDKSPKPDSVFTPKKKLSNAYETTSGSKFMRSTHKSGLGGEDEHKYLTSDEIEKLSDPNAGLTQVVTDLESKDWETQANACNVLRSLAIHSPKMLTSATLRDIVPSLIKIAQSLRSSVSKNGLLAFQDIFDN